MDVETSGSISEATGVRRTTLHKARNNEFAVARNFWISQSIHTLDPTPTPSSRSTDHVSFLPLTFPFLFPSSPLPLAPRQPSGAVRRRRGRWLGGVARLDGGGGRRRRGAEARRGGAARRAGGAGICKLRLGRRCGGSGAAPPPGSGGEAGGAGGRRHRWPAAGRQ